MVCTVLGLCLGDWPFEWFNYLENKSELHRWDVYTCDTSQMCPAKHIYVLCYTQRLSNGKHTVCEKGANMLSWTTEYIKINKNKPTVYDLNPRQGRIKVILIDWPFPPKDAQGNHHKIWKTLKRTQRKNWSELSVIKLLPYELEASEKIEELDLLQIKQWVKVQHSTILA